MKITRIELCHPVNRPGKRDDNYKELPPPGAKPEDWSLEADELLAGISISGVRARLGKHEMFVPISNIRSIDYEETKKK
jgi:hypothetical protein